MTDRAAFASEFWFGFKSELAKHTIAPPPGAELIVTEDTCQFSGITMRLEYWVENGRIFVVSLEEVGRPTED